MPPESTYSAAHDDHARREARRDDPPGAHGPRARPTVLVFPAERVLFGVDFVNVNSVPGTNTLANGAPVAEYINALKLVEGLDFDIVAPGHGPMGKKADIVAHRQYYENIAERVAAGIKPRQTLEQLQAAEIMDEYKDSIEYDEDNDINIANVYKTLSADTLTGRRGRCAPFGSPSVGS